MTREEAIDHLKTIGQYYSQDHSDPYEECEILTKDELDALYLAIKALEQESCDDMVSCGVIEQAMWERDVAIEQLKKLGYGLGEKPKTGHWIGHREHCENLGVIPSGLGAYEWCSNCDCGIDVREWHRNHYNYCPNCGCLMVEPQESEG